MSNTIAICNSALLTLGANTIQSFSDGSEESTACSVKWDIARRAMLRTHPWNFSIKRRVLARSTSTPEFRYSYKYTIPSESLRIMRVYLDGDYKLEGREILTNSPTCELKYIYDNEDVSSWDALFVELMAAKLSYELAYTLPRTRTMIDAMFVLYKDKLSIARGVNGQEDIEDTLDQFIPSLIGVRY